MFTIAYFDQTSESTDPAALFERVATLAAAQERTLQILRAGYGDDLVVFDPDGEIAFAARRTTSSPRRLNRRAANCHGPVIRLAATAP